MSAFPITLATPGSYPRTPPRESEVVVIGGGVIGVCTALFLARAGRQVTLLEKGRIAAEQSSRNWGWIRQQGRDPDELPIMVEAARLWRELAPDLDRDIRLQQTGVTYLAETEAKMQRFAGWLPHAKTHGVDSRLLDADAVAKAFPGLAGTYAGALTTPSDMRAEPWAAVPALAALAAREGVKIIENCAVRRLDISAGHVAGVVTEAGAIRCSSVVLAGGAWSALFLRAHGVSLPQLSVRESVLATNVLPEVHVGAAAEAGLAFRRRADGGYTLAPGGRPDLYVGPDAFRALRHYLPQLRQSPFGQRLRAAAPRGFPDAWRTPRNWAADAHSPFEAMRILDPMPDHRALRRARKRFAALYPDLPPVTARASWAGMIDTMPDIVPVVDACAQIPGLVIGTGMSGHGFGIGPAMGRVLSALVMGDAPGHDLRRFRADRFSDGSAIRLGPTF
ncbi:FAD-binding oxidoreductase [Sulfitobacter sp. R18_1]|uniref:NAD(P)/FAD-dependent oxidoreductase n=1 Tax=Sulfitobacter sp. R18_1 TaxID=2821104 RepID=UPI001ADD2A46|nr:FAD-binding oxidoreductase [Sulfitobacter sp. R18_1]MBO9430444.1 FAD-binding oxidoreductase [Sulfitobacter sp. R18_1]